MKSSAGKNRGMEFLRKNNVLFILILLLFGIAGIEAYISSGTQQSPIRINEVCSNNFSIIADSEGVYFDYIELYNASEQEMSLEGFFLSDNRKDLQAKDLSGLTIGSKGFLLIAAVGENEDNGIDRAGFCLSSEGEVLYLSNEDGKIVDIVRVPGLRYDQVYARTEDGGKQWKIMSATPMGKNEEGSEAYGLPGRYFSAPEFSVEGGFYESEFSVLIMLDPEIERRIRWKYPGDLYYTLDGGIPTRESAVYEEAGIPVGKGITVLRARYIDENGLAGDIASVTYFVGEGMPQGDYIVSVIVDEDDLYDEEKGICAEGKAYLEWAAAGGTGNAPEKNYEKKGNKWEREANVELFIPEGKVNQKAGIRVQGAGSRGDTKKRFTLVSRKIYSGEYYFPVSLYGDKKLHSFYFRTGFANAVYPELVRDREVATQESIPASVYINGMFYYDTYLTEKFSKDYFAQTYNVDKDNVIVMSDGEFDERESDRAFFDELIVALGKDLSQEAAYRLVEEKMDIQSYIDFLCIQIYIGNTDIGDNKNIRMWRTREVENTVYGDGRWRWVLYDLDDCDIDEQNMVFYEIDDMAKMDTFTVTRRYVGNSYHESYMFAQLKKNEEFCMRFVNSFMDMANENFSDKNVEKVFEKYGGAETYRNGFFLRRRQYIVPYLAEEFDLQGTTETLEIQMDTKNEGGYVEVNTIKPDLSSGAWQGEYFTDYPVTLTAVCEEGYRFAGWEGDIKDTSKTIEITLPAGGISIVPVFEKITEKAD